MGRSRNTVSRFRSSLNEAKRTPFCLTDARLVTRTGNPAFVVSDQVATSVGSSSGGDEGPCPKSRRGVPGGDHVAASGCSARGKVQPLQVESVNWWNVKVKLND